MDRYKSREIKTSLSNASLTIKSIHSLTPNHRQGKTRQPNNPFHIQEAPSLHSAHKYLRSQNRGHHIRFT